LPPCRPLPDPAPRARACPRRALATRAAFVSFALAALLAGPARAFQLTSIRPAKVTQPGDRGSNGQLWVDVQLEQPIEPRVAASLSRGMPATLTLHVELWRRRTAWFDRMERAVDATFRLHYNLSSSSWHLDRPGQPPLSVSTLDSLQILLEHTLTIPVASLDRIGPETSCYVVVSASLRPLSIEDVEEVEGWLSGEVQEKRHSGLGILTGIPRSLFEAARNFAGFGDERSRMISNDFTPANLPLEGH